MICPQCRDVASFHEHREKTFTTLLGTVRAAARPYYHCRHCHSGYCPGDTALGLADRRLSLGAEQVVALGGTLTSFDEAAAKILPRMAGIRLAESTVERTTEAAGERLGQVWARGQVLGTARAWNWNRDAAGRRVAYISVDATGVGIQGPHGARAEGKMVTVGMIFHPAAFDPDAPRDARPIAQARYLAGLTDGGQGLDEFLRVYFPRATLILDFYHAAGHLAELAKAWADDAASAADLLDRWRHQMRHDGGGAVLRTLEALDRNGRGPEALEVHRRVTHYVRKNEYRMDYPTYSQKGWQIGSGSMEAGCKTVVCQRLCGSGMRWGRDGADTVSHLRALFQSESSQWEAFWSRSPN